MPLHYSLEKALHCITTQLTDVLSRLITTLILRMSSKHSYIRLPSDEDIRDKNDLESDLLSSCQLPNRRRGRTVPDKYRNIGIFGILSIINAIFLCLHISYYSKLSKMSSELVYCKWDRSLLVNYTNEERKAPASGAVENEVRTFNTSLFVKNRYNGYPNDENHMAWKELDSRKLEKN
jgi:hypothetical protein